MTKLGSRKLHISLNVTKMGSVIGHRIDYNGVKALRGQRHISSKNYPLPPPRACYLPYASLAKVGAKAAKNVADVKDHLLLRLTMLR